MEEPKKGESVYIYIYRGKREHFFVVDKSVVNLEINTKKETVFFVIVYIYFFYI